MKEHRYVSVLVFTISLVVYLLTICPTIYVGDSGEIISAAYTLGVPHPPGYPLYMLLSKLFMFIPLSNIAFRANFVAALFGSSTVFMLFLLLNKIVSLNRWISSAVADSPLFTFLTFFTALLFAFSKTFWAQCVQAKGGLYTLNAFFLVLLLYLCVIYSFSTSFTLLVLISVICGLSLANHHTIAPLTFILLGYILWCTYESNRKKILLYLFTFLALGTLVALVTYLYLPIRSLANPPMDWGNPETLQNIFHHVFRGQYGTISERTRSIGLFSKQLGFYFKFLFEQFTIIPLIFVFFGFKVMWKNLKRFSIILILMFLATTLGIILLTNFSINILSLYMIEVFYIPSYIITCIFILAGNIYLLNLIPKNLKLLLLMLIIILVMCCLISNYSVNDRSKNYFAYDYAINLLKSTDNGSTLLVAGDNASFTLSYLTMVEGKGIKNDYYDDYGLIFSNSHLNLKEIPATDYLKRRDYINSEVLNSKKPSYFVLGSYVYKDIMTTLANEYKAEPVGLLYQIIRKNEKAVYKSFTLFKFRGLHDETIYKDYMVRDIIAQYYYFYGEYLRKTGKTAEADSAYQKAKETGYDNESIQTMLGILSQQQGDVSSALKLAKKAIEIEEYSAEAWNNYGVALSRTGKNEDAVEAYKKALKINPQTITYYNNLAGAYSNLGNYNEALKTYEEGAKINERGLDYHGIGITYTKMGRLEDAMRIYLKGISINPAFELYYGLGNTYLAIGKIPEALKAYNEAIKINPNVDKVYVNLGVAYIRLGDKNKAIVFFKKAIELNPKCLDAYNNLALTYLTMGQKEESIKLWLKILEIDPLNQTAKSNIEKVKN